MRVHAAIFERTLTTAFVEQTARNFTERVAILRAERFFCIACCVEERWDDQIACLTADWTRPEVMLR